MVVEVGLHGGGEIVQDIARLLTTLVYLLASREVKKLSRATSCLVNRDLKHREADNSAD